MFLAKVIWGKQKMCILLKSIDSLELDKPWQEVHCIHSFIQQSFVVHLWYAMLV